MWWLWPSFLGLLLHGTVEDTVQIIRSWGTWNVVGSIALMMLHSFLPFPAEILACANGMLFRPVWGAVITWIGAMLGAGLAFGLGRQLGRPFVKRVLPLHHRKSMDAWSLDYGATALLMSRLIPLIAFNLINYAASLTEISWWTFLWTTGLGILPLTVLLSVAGDQMLAVPFWSWALVSVALGVSWYLADCRVWPTPTRSTRKTHAGR